MLTDDLLLQVMKPARYIGEEWNVCRKDFDGADFKFALCFPDLYEIGMSNLGVRILYGVLNAYPHAACERFFAPAADWEKILRDRGQELSSLESGRNLRDFDVVGFSLGFELGYTTVLNMLELGGIPLLSSQRTEDYPLVIGGGPCAFNPEPMHAFFDLFIIGEAEEAIVEFCSLYRQCKKRLKSAAMRKQDFLIQCASIEGVYVPSLYEVRFDSKGMTVEFKPRVNGVASMVRKRIIKDFNSSFFPAEWLVPYIQIVHDRVTLEIMRGCPNTCRFCQARQQYFPFRVRSPEKIIELAKASYARTGYEEISLGGLSVSDYPGLGALFEALIGYFKDKGVGLSLPSIKAKTVVGDVSCLIATIKKTGLTFAPEAGSEKLRNLLSKNFNLNEFFGVLTKAYEGGYQHVKLYFMIGVPFETEADIEAIVELAAGVSELKRKINKGAAQVNISINVLIPKPHTPLQWFKMDTLESLEQKQRYLKSKAARFHKLKLTFHDHRMSLMEAILSRGDRRLSPVIARVFKEGARLEGWDENFVFDRWIRAFREEAIDADFYLRAKACDEILPWDFIDVGVSKEHLREEYVSLTAQGPV